MSLSIENQVIWTDICLKNKKVIEEVIAEAFNIGPRIGQVKDLSIEQVAMQSMEHKGFSLAIEVIFSTIPSDRPVNTKSSFMDMSPERR